MSDNVKPIEQMTKAELVEYVALLEGQRAAEAEERRRLEAQAREAGQAGAGYLITTPSPLYDGVSLGVKFLKGQAFIPLSREFPQFKVVEPTEEYYTKYGIPAEEKARMKQRALLPTATIVANRMRDDYHYAVQYFGVEQLGQVQQMQAVREAEYQQALAIAQRAKVGEGLMVPGMFGAVGG